MLPVMYWPRMPAFQSQIIRCNNAEGTTMNEQQPSRLPGGNLENEPERDLTVQRGRPTKFSEETIDRLCAALADGMPYKGACFVAGIGVTTLSDWRREHPELEERLELAREQARQKALRAI